MLEFGFLRSLGLVSVIAALVGQSLYGGGPFEFRQGLKVGMTKEVKL